jgi:hypothetical protein
MRSWIVIGCFFLMCLGCDRNKAEQAALDKLLSSQKIRRIEFVESNTSKTNVLSETDMQRFLDSIAATNRITKSASGKLYSTIFLIGNDTRESISYFPENQVLSFRKYEFSLRDLKNYEKSGLFR